MRAAATEALANLGEIGNRVSTKTSVGLIPAWNNGALEPSTFLHLLTATSSDDATTARGWTRMDLNRVVADAGPGNAGKVFAAQTIADWIKDAWTGQTGLSSLSSFQVYGDERLRRQLAANIVDYIDSDSAPTDMGEFPEGEPTAPAVIGIEKTPLLVEVDVIYTADDASPPSPTSARIGVKFRFNFFNMYDHDLRLSDYVQTISIKGIPVVVKNGMPIFDMEARTFVLTVGGDPGITDALISAGGDNSPAGVAGARTFLSQEVASQTVTYIPGGSPTQFESGLLEIEVTKDDARVESCRLALRDLQAKFSNASPQPNPNDFLEATPRPKEAASINASYEGIVVPGGSITPVAHGDPRWRPAIPTRRFYNLTRTDTTRFTTSDDKAEIDSRTHAIDWHDYVGNRPLAYFRNAPMQSVGELGNVANCEYPWRSVYLQYAGRPESTIDAEVAAQVQDRRGSSAAAQTNPSLLPQDYVLLDLFRTSSEVTRAGSINLNSQFNIRNVDGEIDQGAIPSLMSAIPIGPMKDGLGATLGGTSWPQTP